MQLKKREIIVHVIIKKKIYFEISQEPPNIMAF